MQLLTYICCILAIVPTTAKRSWGAALCICQNAVAWPVCSTVPVTKRNRLLALLIRGFLAEGKKAGGYGCTVALFF